MFINAALAPSIRRSLSIAIAVERLEHISRGLVLTSQRIS